MLDPYFWQEATPAVAGYVLGVGMMGLLIILADMSRRR